MMWRALNLNMIKSDKIYFHKLKISKILLQEWNQTSNPDLNLLVRSPKLQGPMFSVRMQILECTKASTYNHQHWLLKTKCTIHNIVLVFLSCILTTQQHKTSQETVLTEEASILSEMISKFLCYSFSSRIV